MATDQGQHPELPPLRPREVSEAQLGRRSRRSFLSGAIAAAAGYGAWHWLRTRRMEDGVAWPIRRMLRTNEEFALDLFGNRRAESYPAGTAQPNPRVNEDVGMTSNLNLAQWRLRVEGLATGNGQAQLTLADIKALPKIETTMRLCCIEGWSILVNWGGASFRDFVTKYPPRGSDGKPVDLFKPSSNLFQYVSMRTPDDQYYVGLDAESALHPQTLLAYEIDGQPLSPGHGAPLRLVIPTKYGIKNIKRLGTIQFTNDRPKDYWAERGYDWYAGL